MKRVLKDILTCPAAHILAAATAFSAKIPFVFLFLSAVAASLASSSAQRTTARRLHSESLILSRCKTGLFLLNSIVFLRFCFCLTSSIQSMRLLFFGSVFRADAQTDLFVLFKLAFRIVFATVKRTVFPFSQNQFATATRTFFIFLDIV